MAIGHYEDKFSLTDTGLPAVGAVYTVKNAGTGTGATLTNAAGTPTGSSTFITDSRGNGGFYASDTLGYDIYDGGGTLILTDIRVVDIGGGGGALSYSSAIPADTTTGAAAAGTSTTGAPHADHTHHIGAHATTHNSGGSDAVTVAQSQVTGLAASLAALLPLAGGTLTGSLDIGTAGQGLKVAEGANAKQGTATLVAGTVTVANTSVTTTSRIFLTTQTPGGTIGMQYVSARTAGASFTISSTSPADTSTVAFFISEVG